MSQQFTTTQMSPGAATHDEAKALALAFAVVGRLIAEGLIQVDLGDKDWHVDYKHHLQSVAGTVHDFIEGGF